MGRVRDGLAVACVLGLPLTLGGCAGALVIGGLTAAAGGGYAAGQERGMNGSVSDFTLKKDVERALLQANPQLQAGVNTTVYDGRVLLTGRVPYEQMKMAAGQSAGRVSGARAVYNEIEVGGAGGTWDEAQDAWITTRVRSEMVLEPAVRSVNYTIDTTNGTVYLIGSARSQAELDRATQVARYVPGVKRVVSYVELRYGTPVASAPPRTNMAPSQPSAPPGGAIEVQKL